jgi:hypothetical protein
MGIPNSQSNNSIILTNGQIFNNNLGRSFAGWNIDYTVQNPLNGSNTVTFQKPSAQNFIYSNRVPNPSNMTFMYSFGLSANNFAYILQDINEQQIWKQICTVDGKNYNCQLLSSYFKFGPLNALAMQKIFGKTTTVVCFATSD